ncbi:MAG: hypothetical protein WD669_05660 [Pirellulales bacterium]
MDPRLKQLDEAAAGQQETLRLMSRIQQADTPEELYEVNRQAQQQLEKARELLRSVGR